MSETLRTGLDVVQTGNSAARLLYRDAPAPKCTENDLKKSHICPIWGQSDPVWMPNLTPLCQMNFYKILGQRSVVIPQSYVKINRS